VNAINGCSWRSIIYAKYKSLRLQRFYFEGCGQNDNFVTLQDKFAASSPSTQIKRDIGLNCRSPLEMLDRRLEIEKQYYKEGRVEKVGCLFNQVFHLYGKKNCWFWVESVFGRYDSDAYLPSTSNRCVFFFSLLITKKKTRPIINRGVQNGSNVILLYAIKSPIKSKQKKAVIIPNGP